MHNDKTKNREMKNSSRGFIPQSGRYWIRTSDFLLVRQAL